MLRMEIGVIEAQTAMQDEARPARSDAAVEEFAAIDLGVRH